MSTIKLSNLYTNSKPYSGPAQYFVLNMHRVMTRLCFIITLHRLGYSLLAAQYFSICQFNTIVARFSGEDEINYT